MNDVRREELDDLLCQYGEAWSIGDTSAAFATFIRWVEARELEAYERGASTQARLMAWAPKGAEGPRAELERLKSCGIIEAALYNPNVSSYVDHWEGRTLKAESALADALTVVEALGVVLDDCKLTTTRFGVTHNPDAIAAFKRLSARRRA